MEFGLPRKKKPAAKPVKPAAKKSAPSRVPKATVKAKKGKK